MKIIYIILILTTIFSCNIKENNHADIIDESNFIKKQGYVNDIDKGITYARKSYYHIHYTIIYDSLRFQKVTYTTGDFWANKGDALVIYINKNDPDEFFIAHKGICNKNLLTNYLTQTRQELSPFFKKRNY